MQHNSFAAERLLTAAVLINLAMIGYGALRYPAVVREGGAFT